MIIYNLTKKFPSEERFGLTSQINRCIISIASNIAEGAGRNGKNEFRHFIGIAIGSSFELETQLIISQKIGFISAETLKEISEKIKEIQNKLIRLSEKIKE